MIVLYLLSLSGAFLLGFFFCVLMTMNKISAMREKYAQNIQEKIPKFETKWNGKLLSELTTEETGQMTQASADSFKREEVNA